MTTHLTATGVDLNNAIISGSTELQDYETGSYTPTYYGWIAMGSVSTSANYSRIGNSCFAAGSMTFASDTNFGGGTSYKITMPFTVGSPGGGGTWYALDYGSSDYYGICMVATQSYSELRFKSVNGTSDLNNSTPFTWAQNDRFTWQCTFYTTA